MRVYFFANIYLINNLTTENQNIFLLKIKLHCIKSLLHTLWPYISQQIIPPNCLHLDFLDYTHSNISLHLHLHGHQNNKHLPKKSHHQGKVYKFYIYCNFPESISLPIYQYRPPDIHINIHYV
nr:MAG TPA: hypothetical protein [Caudoviricetes sp.]